MLREIPAMNGSDMPSRQDRGFVGGRAFFTGQRVRVIAGPLHDLSGIVESHGGADRVVINAGDEIPGVSIRISPALLEPLD
jgi:hypothetical protein